MRYLTIILLILISLSTFANELPPSGVITGKVTAKQTGEPLEGVNVFLLNTVWGAATDSDGVFIINAMPDGKYELRVTMIGYKPATAEIIIGRDDTVHVHAELLTGFTEMGTVVVTGTGTERLIEETPVETEVITLETIKKEKPLNFADALEGVSGVRVENNCANCGFTQVRILGYEGHYTQTLVDGSPVVSTLAGVYALEHFPTQMIDRIEVVKGSASANYGAGSIAGVLNLVTRRPEKNSTSVEIYSGYMESTPDLNVSLLSELVNDDGSLGMFLFGSARSRHSYDRNGDSFSDIGELESINIGMNGYWRMGEHTLLNLSAHRLTEDRRGGNKFNLPPHEADIAEWTDHSRWGGKINLKHQFTDVVKTETYYTFALTKRDSYYGGLSGDSPEARLEALGLYGFSSNPVHQAGTAVDIILDSHFIKAGLAYEYESLEDRSVSSSSYHIEDDYRNIGFYVQDEIFFGSDNQFDVIVGVRADKHSKLSEWVFSPRINAKYRVNFDLHLRAGFTTGFRAPQVFNEDLHIESLGGSQQVITNQPDLEEERAWTATLGIDYNGYLGDWLWMANITGYYSNLSNAFQLEFVDETDSYILWERRNTGGATVRGIELDLGIKPSADLEIRLGTMWKQGEYEETNPDFNTTSFLRSPETSGFMRVNWQPAELFSVYTFAVYTGSMKIPHEIYREAIGDVELKLEESDPIIQIDAGFTYDMHDLLGAEIILSAGMKNIFNAFQDDLDYGVNRDPGFLYGPRLPRTMYVSLETAL